MVAVKVCGVTCEQDAELCVASGADAIGLNFYARSSRCVSIERAARIVAAVGGRSLTVGVFVDAELSEIRRTVQAVGLGCVQLHGDEPPALLDQLLPHAYKAIRVRDEDSIAAARRYAGKHILLDAYVPGEPGGTGATFRWSLATALAAERQVTLAGGLDPTNVRAAIAIVRPYCVDVASGVERAPGLKDPEKVRAFVAAAKGV